MRCVISRGWQLLARTASSPEVHTGALPIPRRLVDAPAVVAVVMDWTVLHRAAFSGDLKRLRSAVEEGNVNPESRDSYGHTPLHLACECVSLSPLPSFLPSQASYFFFSPPPSPLTPLSHSPLSQSCRSREGGGGECVSLSFSPASSCPLKLVSSLCSFSPPPPPLFPLRLSHSLHSLCSKGSCECGFLPFPPRPALSISSPPPPPPPPPPFPPLH